MWQMPVPHQLNLTPQSRVAMLALGKLAVEAGEQRRILVSANREPALTFNASCHARAVKNNVPGTDINKPTIERSGLNSCPLISSRPSCSATSLTLVAIASETSLAQPSSALSARTRSGRSYWPCRRFSTMIPASASAGSVSTYASDHVRVAVPSQFR
jgi:hypothetical protein